MNDPRRWIERWYGSGPERGRWIWTEAGEKVAYIGEGEFSDRLAEVLVAKHNAALANPSGQAIEGPP